jgi:cystathionine beta-lyase family protein involved in aluminum resistance
LKIPQLTPLDQRLVALAQETLRDGTVKAALERIFEIVRFNEHRVLRAFTQAQVSDFHFAASNGYGYDDSGREKLEEIYARVFGAEAALVRGQIVSGTHALALCLYGVLRPGRELLALTGKPYDTLGEIIQGGPGSGSLQDLGVSYREFMWSGGDFDLAAVRKAIRENTSAVLIQRSRGYSLRPSLSIEEIARLIRAVKEVNPHIVTIVDNCYGEFVEGKEPPAAGADLTAGSLIKNPGGGLAPCGGYVVGRESLVELAASRLTAPGLGSKCGPNLGVNRLLFQGFFLAPHMVGEALAGMVFAAAFFQRLGYKVFPNPCEERHDIVQAICLEGEEEVLAFCQAIQAASPINSHVKPEGAPMPGYDTPVIMAAGTFVQGASLELSADAPLRPPYVVYLQGGLTRFQTEFAVLQVAQALLERGLLTL